MRTEVFARGPKNAFWMIVGEAPGREEAARGRPFVGKSGAEQEAYLNRVGLNSRDAYVTNVVKSYIDGNPDPTPERVKEWTPVLEREIRTVQPKLIAAVGRFAARWFLGDDVDMEKVHGIPHRPGAFDPSIAHRAKGAVIVPVYHPAFGMRSPDMRGLIAEDYKVVAEVHRALSSGRSHLIQFPHDQYAGKELYRDVSGKELEAALKAEKPAVFGYDTEGSLDFKHPWSIQVSMEPGSGLMLRYDRKDFARGIAAVQRAVDRGAVVAVHNAMFDVEMSRVMGLELRDAKWWDTMYAAYLLRNQPKGLKPLAYRLEGMEMQEYADVTRPYSRDLQIDYLLSVAEHEWEEYEGRVITENDGSARWYTPRALDKSAWAILNDLIAKPETEGVERWRGVDEELRSRAEAVYGPFPEASLDDAPLDEALFYSCRDSDAAIRFYLRMPAMLKAKGVDTLMAHGMQLLPVFEEMQHNGMHTSRGYFQALYDEMGEDMARFQSQLSNRYYSGEPFNPASGDKVAALMRRRGLEGEKRTKSGKMSTSKKSIEHLRKIDEAIDLVMNWRERQKVRESFCAPVLARLSPDLDPDELVPVRCQLLPTGTVTRRLASKNPNFLAMPTRSELGKKVREGYVAPPGYVFGGWDLSQIELRYLAHESGDPLMCKRYIDGADLHTETAAAIFNVPVAEVDKERQRAPAKNAGFGIVYGISGAGLYDQLRMMGGQGWSVEACDELITKWLNVYPGVKEYKKRVAKEVSRTGVVRDRWGMMRSVHGIWSSDRRDRAEAERIAVSHRIQGGAQGMIQNAMRWLRPHIRQLQLDGVDVRWVLQIHDEIILCMPEDWYELIDALVIEAMTQHHGVDDMRVPVESSGSRATTWGGLK